VPDRRKRCSIKLFLNPVPGAIRQLSNMPDVLGAGLASAGAQPATKSISF
jgi:hypothetical protein